MAVQKSRKTPATRGNRRSHDTISLPCISIDKKSNETHLRHNITKSGFYKGKKII